MSDEEITRAIVEEGQLPSGVLKLRLSSIYGKFGRSVAPEVAEAVTEVMDDLLGELFDEARREDLVDEDIERALGPR